MTSEPMVWARLLRKVGNAQNANLEPNQVSGCANSKPCGKYLW